MLQSVMVLLACLSMPAGAETTDSPGIRRVVESNVDAVVLHRNLAEVERSVQLELEAGQHELVFANLPVSTDLEHLRAAASGDWEVGSVTVRPMTEPVSAGRAAAGSGLGPDGQQERRRLELRKAGIQQDLRILEQIGGRIGSQADGGRGQQGGEQLDAIQRHLEFIRTERAQLNEALLEIEHALRQLQVGEDAGGNSADSGTNAVHNEAIVQVMVPSSGNGEVRLSYEVDGAAWEPVYAVRQDSGSGITRVQYDAKIWQSTGEDWDSAILTLSTREPNRPGGPRPMVPVYVNVADEEGEMDWQLPAAGERVDEDAPAISGPRRTATWSPVRYTLPRRVRISSSPQGSQAVRIAEFDAPAKRIHVANPHAEEMVFIRTDLENASPFVLLPGKVSLFRDGDLIGPTSLREVPPGGRFELWWGADPDIRASRTMLERSTTKTGLLGGGRLTVSRYRIDLANVGREPVEVELWDRLPVSRSDDIEVRVADVQPELVDDEAYLEDERERGFLKWQIPLPPSGDDGDRRQITWSVRVNRSADTDITPIPE